MKLAACVRVCARGAWAGASSGWALPPWPLGRTLPAALCAVLTRVWSACPQIPPLLRKFQSSLPNKEFTFNDIHIPVTLPRCVLEAPSPSGPSVSGSGATWRGKGLTGPPPSPGGDRPAPASLESGPSGPGTQKAEEDGSEAAPGGGALGP